MMDRLLNEKKLKGTSKLLALILRHKPETVGITLDEHGWAKVDEVVAGISKLRPFSLETLELIVANDEKERYSFCEDKTRIRANYGHSVKIDPGYVDRTPPDVLYHGTAEKNVPSILEHGLTPGSRLYVHLTENADTAKQVGARHGSPTVFRVDSKRMKEDGYAFFLSSDKVWLVDQVPKEYLEQTDRSESTA